MRGLYNKVKAWLAGNGEPALKITFTPETPTQRATALTKPWWEEIGADEAKQLIRDEAVRRGKTPPSPTSGHGSGWWIEFPRYVAYLVRERGTDEASRYVKWTFDQGTSRDASDKLQEMYPDENPCVAYWG